MKETDGWVKIKKYTDCEGDPVCANCPHCGNGNVEWSDNKNRWIPGPSCQIWHGESKSEDPDIRHRAEDYDCAMKYLDDLGAPTEDEGGAVFSIIGRIARIPSESKSEWQPIETAAKNPRERILLFFPKFAGVQIGWFFAQEGWIDVSGPFGRSTPTHWMPLPSPPQGNKP